MTASSIVASLRRPSAAVDWARPAPRPTILWRFKVLGLVAAALAVLWAAGFGAVYAFGQAATPQSVCLQPCAGEDGVVVVVHGWLGTPDGMRPLAEHIRSIKGFEHYRIRLHAFDASRFSNRHPSDLAKKLSRDIRGWSLPGKPLVLVGHSTGGLIVRRAYLDATSDNEPWAALVSRIILLAAPNRGATAISRNVFYWVADGLARSYGVGRFIQANYRGAPFIVNLRLEWIRRFPQIPNRPVVAQLLGSQDSIVNPNDSVDVLQFPEALSFTLPNSTHASILDPAESGPYLEDALTKAPAPDPGGRPSGQSVFKVMVVHGIRDYGERFQALTDQIEAAARQHGLMPIPAALRYRYFSAFEFINPLSRRARVLDFADEYTELVAKPPVSAPIHFVGHSFGTYLMGKSVADYGEIHFDRVYLAGSVLAESFLATPGGTPLLGNKLQFVRNDVAAKDWPVGILCSGLQQAGLADPLIGTAGFNGFTGFLDRNRNEEHRYFAGGHSEALEPYNLSTIVSWVTNSGDAGGAYDPSQVKQYLTMTGKPLLSTRSWAWSFASRIAGLLLALVVAGIAYLLLATRRPLVGWVTVVAILWLLKVI